MMELLIVQVMLALNVSNTGGWPTSTPGYVLMKAMLLQVLPETPTDYIIVL